MVKEEIGILDEGNGKGREMISVVNMGAADASKMGKILTLSLLLQIGQKCPLSYFTLSNAR